MSTWPPYQPTIAEGILNICSHAARDGICLYYIGISDNEFTRLKRELGLPKDLKLVKLYAPLGQIKIFGEPK